jgi:DNA repair exonuclease SbcCD ATPase subunit
MTDPLSIVASASAVVNMADLVCKSMKEMYTFIAAMKSAPKEIQLLGEQLLGLEEIVAKVKDYWSESQQASDQHDTLPAFLSSLTRFKTELEVLKKFFKSTSGADSSLGERLKWVLQESKVSQTIDRLEKHKTTLIATLAIVGRRHDIVLCKEIKSIRLQVDQLILAENQPLLPKYTQMPIPPPNN